MVAATKLYNVYIVGQKIRLRDQKKGKSSVKIRGLTLNVEDNIYTTMV